MRRLQSRLDYQRSPDAKTPITDDHDETWTRTELSNSLRSIEWDLEDLEDTVSIVEKNPSHFNIEQSEIKIRKEFIQSTKDEIARLKKLTQGEKVSRTEKYIFKTEF